MDNNTEEKKYEISDQDTFFLSRVNKVKDSLINEGYLSPEIFYVRNDSIKIVHIKKSKRFKWAAIRFDKNIALKIFNRGDEILKMNGTWISPKQFSYLSENILKTCENSGYPFAVVYLDSISFLPGDSINAKLYVILNKKFFFDTIKIVSKLELSQKYLQNFLDIRKGDVYQRNKVDAISKMIENIPFVRLKDAPGIFFFGDKVSVNLDLLPRQVNRFDFLLGLQRDLSNGVNKYILTGDIFAELVNKLGRGERIFFNYKNLSKAKQELKIQANYPYLLDLPFGIDTKFEIFLNESEYRDVSFDLGVLYLLRKSNSIKVYWNRKSSRLLSIDTLQVLAKMQLPDNLDISTNNLGLIIGFNSLDYNFSPTKGFSLLIDSQAGLRNIIVNQTIRGLKNDVVDFTNSYDSLKNNSYGVNIVIYGDKYLKLTENFILKFSNNSGIKLSQKRVFQNELYRLGGLRLLRGFDENTVTGDFYSVNTIEFRLLINKNSNIYLFSDYAFVRNPFSDLNKWDRPYGLGAGINFDTKAGMLQLVAATGSQYGNPLNLKNPNVHIGYTSLFK